MSFRDPRASMTPETAGADFDYIIRIIQFLDQRHGIRFFISSKDFDVLYRWWEKRIPFAVIRESLDRVAERSRSRKKPITRFSAFSHDVRKSYQSFLDLGIGGERCEAADDRGEVRKFLAQFPPELEFARGDFEALFCRQLRGEKADAGTLQEKLLAHFSADLELNAKSDWFMRNLSPQLRRPEIERKYRLNYLSGKFAIPALD
jgi:hypothetical protein